MGLNVINDLRLQCPAKEVQFADGGHEWLLVRDLKHDAFAAAIWVKVLFGIGLELAFVAQIDEKLLVVQGVANKVFAAVFRDEPINNAETQGRFTDQIGQDFINVRMRGIESLETGDDELGLAFNLAFARIGCAAGGDGDVH